MSRKKPANRDGESRVSRLFFRLLLAFAIVLLVACAFLVSRPVIRSLTQPPHIRIVDELPTSARLVRYELSRCGFDYAHLFEFSCSDTALRDTLVSKWRLRDLTDSDEDPVSFMEYDPPDWWPSDISSATRKFGWVDRESETYLSVWEYSETGRLYVEYGKW